MFQQPFTMNISRPYPKLCYLFTHCIPTTPMPPYGQPPLPAPSIASPAPAAIKIPATLLLAMKTFRIYLPFNQSISPLPWTSLLLLEKFIPTDTASTRMDSPPTVDTPNKPLVQFTISNHHILALASSIRVYPYKCIEKWALSEVLYPNLALAVLDPNPGNSIKQL